MGKINSAGHSCGPLCPAFLLQEGEKYLSSAQGLTYITCAHMDEHWGAVTRLLLAPLGYWWPAPGCNINRKLEGNLLSPSMRYPAWHSLLCCCSNPGCALLPCFSLHILLLPAVCEAKGTELMIYRYWTLFLGSQYQRGTVNRMGACMFHSM